MTTDQRQTNAWFANLRQRTADPNVVHFTPDADDAIRMLFAALEDCGKTPRPDFRYEDLELRPLEEERGQRLVLMSEELFRQLGADRVDWGKPDARGVYTPTLYKDYAPSRFRRLLRWLGRG